MCLVRARRPHVLGSAGSHVPQWTPRVHSQQEGAFPQSVHVVTAGAEERVSAAPRHVSRGRVPLSQPVSPSSSMLIVSHLHVDTTCGSEVRAHRRVSGLRPPGGRSPRTQPLTQHLSGASRCPLHYCAVLCHVGPNSILIVHTEQRKCPFPPTSL